MWSYLMFQLLVKMAAAFFCFVFWATFWFTERTMRHIRGPHWGRAAHSSNVGILWTCCTFIMGPCLLSVSNPQSAHAMSCPTGANLDLGSTLHNGLPTVKCRPVHSSSAWAPRGHLCWDGCMQFLYTVFIYSVLLQSTLTSQSKSIPCYE